MRRPSLPRLLWLLFVLATPPLSAQEAPELGWSGNADLSLVAASGNAEALTLGFKGALRSVQTAYSLGFEAGALSAEATTTLRTAVLLPGGAVALIEEEETRKTAEAFFLRGRYDRKLGGPWSWFAGAGWERNEFAGFSNRTSGMGGIARTWFETDAAKLRTDAALTYTREELVAEVPGRDDAFLGLRLAWDYLRALTSTTTFTSLLALDENLDDTDDLRVDTTNAIAVAMSERLALKASLQLLFDKQPAFVEVPIAGAAPPGPTTLLVELEDLDSILTVAVVVAF